MTVELPTLLEFRFRLALNDSVYAHSQSLGSYLRETVFLPKHDIFVSQSAGSNLVDVMWLLFAPARRTSRLTTESERQWPSPSSPLVSLFTCTCLV